MSSSCESDRAKSVQFHFGNCAPALAIALTSPNPKFTMRDGSADMAQTVSVVQLKPETLDAFQAYVREAEAAMEPTLDGRAPFLWSDENADRARPSATRAKFRRSFGRVTQWCTSPAA